MCTVTYLPIGNDSFILTSSRDEKKSRPVSTPPSMQDKEGLKLLYPVDPVSEGTWIAADEKGRAACLLNGAFEKHNSRPLYRKSRGLIIPDLFNYTAFAAFFSDYDFSDIEPFTLIHYYREELHELRWNGSKVFVKSLDVKIPHIWSSVTLYSPEIIRKREEWFLNWLSEQKIYTRESIFQFHFSTGEEAENAIKMNRENKLFTVSITSIVSAPGTIEMFYLDLAENKMYIKNMSLNQLRPH
jgi:hypothetical protein